MSRPLLESVASRPLMIDVGAADFFQGAINHITSHEHAHEMLDAASTVMARGDDDDFWDEDSFAVRYGLRPYVVVNGILQIPVAGALLSRFPYQVGRWATGYTYIERAIKRGMADSNVVGIALIMDTPGGEVSGCFELVDKMFAMRGQKPIKAFSANAAYSAGYAIASAADEIIVARSGGTGSVGVVTAHIDFSKALDQMGVKITFIHAGKHKVDGNPYEALPDAVKARIQQRIDKTYGVFTSTVARNRAMDEDDVRATEALTYDSDDSVDVGFADRVGEIEDEMIAFADEVAQIGEEQMTTKTQGNKPAATQNASNSQDGMVDQATHDAAVEQARTEGMAAGRTAERERMSTILGSDEAKARPKAAMSMALRSKDEADDVVSMLADLPEESAAAPAPATGQKQGTKATGTPFDNAMSASGNPQVGTEGQSDDDDDEGDHASAILADFGAYTGAKKKKA